MSDFDQASQQPINTTPTGKGADKDLMMTTKKRKRSEEITNEEVLDAENLQAEVKKISENLALTNAASFGIWPIGEIGNGTGKHFVAQLSNLKGASNFLFFRQGNDDLMSLGNNSSLLKLTEKGFSTLCKHADEFVKFAITFQAAKAKYEEGQRSDMTVFDKLQMPKEVLLDRNVDLDGARGNVKIYTFCPTKDAAFIMVQFVENGYMKKKYEAAKKSGAEGEITAQNRNFAFRPAEFLIYVEAVIPFIAECAKIVKEQGKNLCDAYKVDMEEFSETTQHVDMWKKRKSSMF